MIIRQTQNPTSEHNIITSTSFIFWPQINHSPQANAYFFSRVAHSVTFWELLSNEMLFVITCYNLCNQLYFSLEYLKTSFLLTEDINYMAFCLMSILINQHVEKYDENCVFRIGSSIYLSIFYHISIIARQLDIDFTNYIININNIQH